MPACPATAAADVLFGPAPRQVNVTMAMVAADSSPVNAGSIVSPASACRVTVHDVVDGLSTRIYRLRPPRSRKQPQTVTEPTKDPHAANLIFNGGFEASTSGPGTADGVMAAWGGDGSATQFTDTSHVREGQGRHAMRITTPAHGKGLRLWTYPVKAPMFVNST